MGQPTLPPEDTGLNLPLGSFVNRYFINRVEALDPFIDNVKPVQRSLLPLARQRPLRIVRSYFGGWRFIRRAIANRRFNGAVLTIALLLLAPFLLPLLLFAILGVRDALLGWLGIGESARVVLAFLLGPVFDAVLPCLPGVVGELRRRLPAADHHLDAARRIAAYEFAGSPRDAVYVCMGHTHVTAVKRIDTAGRRLYVNTGTRIARWPSDRPDLLGRTVYTYALFEATGDAGYRARLLEWDTSAQRPWTRDDLRSRRGLSDGHGFRHRSEWVHRRHLVRLLLSRGDYVVGLVRTTSDASSLRALFDDYGGRLRLVVGDMREPASLGGGLAGADYVFHLGAVLLGRRESDFRNSIVDGTSILLDAVEAHAAESLKRFLMTSSLAAAGPSPDGEPLDEQAECRPVSWYGKAKRDAEELVRARSERLPVTIVRPVAVYGEGELELARGTFPIERSPATAWPRHHRLDDLGGAVRLALPDVAEQRNLPTTRRLPIRAASRGPAQTGLWSSKG